RIKRAILYLELIDDLRIELALQHALRPVKVQRVKYKCEKGQRSRNKSEPPENKQTKVSAGEDNQPGNERRPLAECDGVGARIVLRIECKIADFVVEMPSGESQREKQCDQNPARVDRRKNCITEQEMEQAADQMWK